MKKKKTIKEETPIKKPTLDELRKERTELMSKGLHVKAEAVFKQMKKVARVE